MHLVHRVLTEAEHLPTGSRKLGIVTNATQLETTGAHRRSTAVARSGATSLRAAQRRVAKRRMGRDRSRTYAPHPMMRFALVSCVVVAGCLPTENGPPARWHYLHTAIIQPSCATAGCHSALTAIAGINLADAEGGYAILTGHICGQPSRPEDPPRNYVTPWSSDYSELIYQLRGVTADGRPYRNVMPRDTPLPDVEIDLIARWIDGGAPCD